MATLIEGGKLVTEIDSYEASILVENGRISQIGKDLTPPDGAERYDAAGKLVLPGVVDAHVHVGLSLRGSHSSDFLSTTRGAAYGGVTTILTYVTPVPDQSLPDAVDERKAEASGHCYIDYGLHAALVNWEDRSDAEILRLIDEGIPSFKMYTVYSGEGWKSDEEKLYHAFLLTGQHGGLVEVHCENEWVIERKIRRFAEQGRLSPTDHAASRPSYAEGDAVAGVIRAAYAADAPCYIVHVSTAEAVRAIEEADDLGIEVYSETCPHFLVLDEGMLAREDGQRYATCPPLRPKAHQAPLWEALEEGIIQVVSTDHCEFMAADKDAAASDFRKIPMGLPGVGTLLPLLWHFGVGEGRITENELVDRLCTQPSEIFGLHPRKGTLAKGSDADLVIFDPALNVTVAPAVLNGYSDYSPYDGWEIRGWPVSTMARGRWVVKDRELLGEPEHGSFVERGKVCQSPGNR